MGFSRALATVRRDAKRRAQAVRISPCSPCIVCCKNKKQHPAGCCFWRRRWDSNPRGIAAKLISSAPSYDHLSTSAYLILLQGTSRRARFRVFWYILQLTVFVGTKRKLSEDDSTDLRRKMLKRKSFLTSERRNSNPFRNADFSGKMREKQAFLARWRDVGEKNRREQKSSIFLIVMGIYRSALTKFYANSPLPQKSNRPCLLLMSSNNGR